MIDEPVGIERPGARAWLRRLAVDTTPLRESKPFRRLWLGQAISFVGSEITFVAVPYQTYQVTHSTLALGLLGLCGLVPLLVVPLVGGAIADALDRRRILLAAEVGLALVSAVLVANAALAHPRVWPLYVCETLGTVCFSFTRPAMRALLPSLVGDEQIAAAAALEGLYGNLAAVAGPALGGILIAALGLTGAYAIDLGTFAASFVSVWLLPPSRPAGDPERASLASIAAGFRYVRSQPPLLGIFLVDTNAMIFGMPMVLFPAIGERLGGGAHTVGYLYAAPYAGALAASILSGWVGHVRRQGLGVIVAASVWGAAIAGFGLATALPLALALLAVAGAADYVSAVLRSTILLRVTPDNLRGRMLGIEWAQVAGAPSLGNVEAGTLASLTSVRFSVVSGGIACVAGCFLLALAIPKFLRYDAAQTHA